MKSLYTFVWVKVELYTTTIFAFMNKMLSDELKT